MIGTADGARSPFLLSAPEPGGPAVGTAGGPFVVGTFHAFANCSRGVRAFNDLFVPGVHLEVEELTTGARDLLDLRVLYPEDIQPLDGGFVVRADRVGVQAYDL